MDFITSTSENHIVTITLNRPKALNAFHSQMLSELTDAILTASKKPEHLVIILNSSIEKAFTAGGDIKEEVLLTTDTAYDFAERGKACTMAIYHSPIPVICAVDGYALGGGMEIILASDITVAAKTAKIGIPTINLGGIPGWGSTQLLPRLVGPSLAADILLTGRTLTARECYDLHIIEYLVEKEQLMKKTLELANTITDKAPLAVRNMKKAIHEGLSLPLQDALTLESELFADCYKSKDHEEALHAFLEKRPHRPYHF